MSCSMIGFRISYNTRSWYLPSMPLKPSRIGSSGLLVRKAFSDTELRAFAYNNRWMMTLMSLSRSHSSRASITKTTSLTLPEPPFKFLNGFRISFLNCSLNALLVTEGLSSIAALTYSTRLGSLATNCVAMVVNSKATLPLPRSPLLKKKLAPRSPRSAKDYVTVRDIVDFPVPAMPLSQKMTSL